MHYSLTWVDLTLPNKCLLLRIWWYAFSLIFIVVDILFMQIVLWVSVTLSAALLQFIICPDSIIFWSRYWSQLSWRVKGDWGAFTTYIVICSEESIRNGTRKKANCFLWAGDTKWYIKFSYTESCKCFFLVKRFSCPKGKEKVLTWKYKERQKVSYLRHGEKGEETERGEKDVRHFIFFPSLSFDARGEQRWRRG